MLFGSTTQATIDSMTTGKVSTAKAMIVDIKARSQMPAEYRDRGLMRKHYYEGKSLQHFKTFLHKLYPEGMKKAGEIHPMQVNNFRVYCDTLADVYAPEPPDREVEGHKEGLAEIVKEAKLKRWMPEIEKRAHGSMQQFIRCVPSPITGRQKIQPFWPHDVWAVANPADKTSLQDCLALMALVGENEYEVWTRSPDGEQWYAEVYDLSDDENHQVRPLLNDGKLWPTKTLPWALYQTGISEDLYIETNIDLIDSTNDMNFFWTEAGSIVRNQAHTPIVYSGASDSNIAAGPGAISHLGPNETLTALTLNPQIAPMLEVTKQFSRAHAIANRQPPAAFNSDPSHASSGVARRVENQVAEDARKARVLDAEDFEETQLWPILLEIDAMLGKNRVPVGTEITFIAKDLPDFEEPSVRQMALERLYEIGGIKLEALLVALKMAPNEKVALEQIDPANQKRHIESPNRDRRQESDQGDQRASTAANQVPGGDG